MHGIATTNILQFAVFASGKDAYCIIEDDMAQP